MVTVEQFIKFLQALPEEDKKRPLHCVQLNAGSKVEELRVWSFNDVDVCVDDDGR